MGSITKFCVVIFLCLAISPAQAQNIAEVQGHIFYKFGEQDYIVCQDGFLNEKQYGILLAAYMDHTVKSDLVEKYLKVYGDMNLTTGGRMNDIVAQQKLLITPEHLSLLYTPYQEYLSLDDYFKLHVLHASNIMAAMTQKIGPAKLRTICKTQEEDVPE